MRLVLALCLLLVSASAPAVDLTGPSPGDMTRYELPGYTLVATDNLQLRRDMAKLPRLDRALELAAALHSRPTGIPTRVCVVSTSIWARYLQPSPGIISEFVPARFTNYIIADNTRINRFGLFHEHTHLFLYTQGGRFYPHWFDEGLAQMMESAQFTTTTARIYPPWPDDRGAWIPIERVLSATKDSPDYLDEATTRTFHFEAHSMTYRALIDDVDFGKQVDAYINGLNLLESPEHAQAHFGVDADGLNYQMHAWVNRTKRNYVKVVLGDVSDQPLPAGTPLSRLDALLEIANVSLDTGFGVDRVDELLDAAEREPGVGNRTLVPGMRLAAKRMQDERLLEMLGRAQPGLSDPTIERGVGLALFDRVLTLDVRPASPAGAEQMKTRSFELLNHSLEAHPEDPEAVWAYATLSASLKKDLDLALQRLAPMFERLPRNPDLAHAAALVMQARGDPSVVQFYKATFLYAHTLEEKRWAAAQLAALNEKAAAPAAR